MRPAAVAGMFYPANADVLRRDITGYLASATVELAATATPANGLNDQNELNICPKAIIVPHAGYVYSGSTAALAYATIAPFASTIKHVVLLGPAHYVGARAAVLPEADALETPLGTVPVWAEAARTVLSQNRVIESAEVHRQEHSLEVQLPFLQCVLGPGFDVLPLAVSWVSAGRVAEAVHSVWNATDTLVVVSSDLSHYHSYPDAQRLDSATIAQVLALDPTIDHDQACGATGIDALLLLAAERNLTPTLLGACNSGDTAGDKRRVVGYSAFRFD
jgi:AmmeMemoRadiSam system protein B